MDSQNETPAVCDNCLGDNPYIEMKRLNNGSECKICSKIFTVFKWNNNKSNLKGTANLRKTVICSTCSRSKNCCQSCMLDLTFGIDIATRDNLLKLAKIDNLNDLNELNLNITNDVVSNAKNITSRLYNSRQLESKFKNDNNGINHLIDNDNSMKLLESKLSTLVENSPNNKDTSSKKTFIQNVKLLPFNSSLGHFPSNNNVRSFFLFGIPSSLSESQILDYFNNLISSTVSISLYSKEGKFAFIEFKSRQLAETTANKLLTSKDKKYKSPLLITIENNPIRVCWSSRNNNEINFNEDELKKVSNIVNKQMIKLSKQDYTPNNNKEKVTHSKIAKKN